MERVLVAGFEGVACGVSHYSLSNSAIPAVTRHLSTSLRVKLTLPSQKSRPITSIPLATKGQESLVSQPLSLHPDTVIDASFCLIASQDSGF